VIQDIMSDTAEIHIMPDEDAGKAYVELVVSEDDTAATLWLTPKAAEKLAISLIQAAADARIYRAVNYGSGS
jgi:hypothetical protein